MLILFDPGLDSLLTDEQGDRQENREGSHNPYAPHNTHVDQPQADSEDQDGSVQCLCHQHTAIRQ